MVHAPVYVDSDTDSDGDSDVERCTCLISAAMNGDMDLVAHLLNQSATDIDAQDSGGYTALGYASARGYFHIVELLLRKGANIETTNNTGETALMSACREQHLGIVTLLIAYGANTAAVMDEGISVMHAAIDSGPFGAGTGVRFKIVKLLVEYGADVNVTSDDGSSHLHAAVATADRNVVGYLLPLVADITAVNNLNMSPLQEAEERELVYISNLIRAEISRRTM
jgi:uncharacterized protein